MDEWPELLGRRDLTTRLFTGGKSPRGEPFGGRAPLLEWRRSYEETDEESGAPRRRRGSMFVRALFGLGERRQRNSSPNRAVEVRDYFSLRAAAVEDCVPTRGEASAAAWIDVITT